MRLPATLLLLVALPLPISCSTGGNGASGAERKPFLPRIEKSVSYQTPEGESVAEGTFSVDGRLLFPVSFTVFQISTTTGEKIDAVCPGWADKASALDTGEIYQFELLAVLPADTTKACEVLRMSKDGKVLIDNSICELHRTAMKREPATPRAMIAYPGLRGPAGQAEEFPNDGNEYVGCGTPTGLPSWKCTKCSRSYRAWVRRHGIDDTVW